MAGMNVVGTDSGTHKASGERESTHARRARPISTRMVGVSTMHASRIIKRTGKCSSSHSWSMDISMVFIMRDLLENKVHLYAPRGVIGTRKFPSGSGREE